MIVRRIAYIDQNGIKCEEVQRFKMSKTTNDKLSRFISLTLRHKPETIGITLDSHGWANVDELIEGISKKYPIDIDILNEIVRTDEKQRYSFNEDRTKIRANQGHSIKVDLDLDPIEPPEYLYHGTAWKYVTSIQEVGLISKSRLYVHLSSDIHTAIEVGRRHGDGLVFRVQSGSMYRDGLTFYKSENGVWLTDHVPVKYLEWYVDEDMKAVVEFPEEE